MEQFGDEEVQILTINLKGPPVKVILLNLLRGLDFNEDIAYGAKSDISYLSELSW